MHLTKFLTSLRLSTFACNQNQREYVLLEMLRHSIRKDVYIFLCFYLFDCLIEGKCFIKDAQIFHYGRWLYIFLCSYWFDCFGCASKIYFCTLQQLKLKNLRKFFFRSF